MGFVPIHNHSDYSLLDGASQLPSMVQRAKELGMPALALTDHGVMYGAIELLKLCKAADIKPIIVMRCMLSMVQLMTLSLKKRKDIILLLWRKIKLDMKIS
mgnify:CR=1 FL=1